MFNVILEVRSDMVYSRDVSRQLRTLGLELVVHDEYSELGALGLTLCFGQGFQFTLDVLPQFRNCVTLSS